MVRVEKEFAKKASEDTDEEAQTALRMQRQTAIFALLFLFYADN